MYQRLLTLLAVVLPLGAAAQAPPVTIGQTFITVALDPAQGNAGWALTTHGVTETLFTVDRAGRIVGRLAETAELQEDGRWLVTLAEGRKFADGVPVDATAVVAALDRLNAANAAARASAGRMSFSVLDPLRFLIRTERPVAVMESVLAEWPLAIARPAEPHPIGTGPFMPVAFRPGDSLELVPSPHFPGAGERPGVTIRRFADPQAMALALEAGELDMAFNLPVEALPRLRRRDGLTVRSFPVGYQYMLWMNTRRGPLADPRVRRAIDLAIDRRELAAAVGAGIPATGAFAATYPFALAEPRPFDPEAAAALLDAAGWHTGPDGTRAKDGTALRLVLTAYPQRPDLVTFQPVLRARLGRLGIGIETRLTEQATATATGGDFELLLWAQHTAPAGDPGFFLNAFLRSDGSNNYTGFASPAVDALLARLAVVRDPAERAVIAAEVQARVFAEAPVAFLLTPEWHVGLGPRLADYEPWGSDYYVVRADLRAR